MQSEISITAQVYQRLHLAQERPAQMTADPSKVFQCLICGRICSSKHCLNEHKYTHTNERNYPCPVCKRMFKYASQLSNHKKCHLKERQIRWLKLTDFVKPDARKIHTVSEEYSKITLPSLSSSVQQFILPKITSLKNF